MSNPYSSPTEPADSGKAYIGVFSTLAAIAIGLILMGVIIGSLFRDLVSIDTDRDFIELMHEHERHESIDFRLHRLDLDLLKD